MSDVMVLRIGIAVVGVILIGAMVLFGRPKKPPQGRRLDSGDRDPSRVEPSLGGENTGDQQFVTLLYENILGRDPAGDPGLQFWLERLAQGATRPEIVVGISESEGHKDLRAPSIDGGIQFIGNPWLLDTSLL